MDGQGCGSRSVLERVVLGGAYALSAAHTAARAIAVDFQKEILGTLPADRCDRFLEELAQVADACRKAAEDSARRE